MTILTEAATAPFLLYPVPQTRLNTLMIARPGPMPDASPVTFETLLAAVGRDRDRDAFIRVFNHFAPRVKSFLMKGGMNPEQADELAQETMLTVWDKARSYDPARAGASTWIFTIARNKRIDMLRKDGHAIHQSDDPAWVADEGENPYDRASRQEDEAALAAAMKTLPAEQADLIRRAFFEEKSHSDIAAETGVPLGTVKSRIRLALERLRHNMRGHAL